MKEPGSVNELQRRINDAAKRRDTTVRRLNAAVANTIVGQMLPPGVVKGGTAMKLRAGETSSRFTPDLDVSRALEITLEDYADELEESLMHGWRAFTGTLVAKPARVLEDVPPQYVMQPFEIKLAYVGKSWLTVKFELGRDEVGSTATRDLRLAEDLVLLFEEVGLPQPAPVPVLAAEHQVVQKLHACTYVHPSTQSNERAHDLVDLQILVAEESIDWAQVGELGERLFAARNAQPWPPTITAYAEWPTIYTRAAEGLNVLPAVSEAVEWANDRVSDAVSRRAPEVGGTIPAGRVISGGDEMVGPGGVEARLSPQQRQLVEVELERSALQAQRSLLPHRELAALEAVQAEHQALLAQREVQAVQAAQVPAPGVLRDRHAAERAFAQAVVEMTDERIAATQQRIQSLSDRLDPDSDRGAELAAIDARLAEIESQSHDLQEALVREQQDNPPAWLLERIGARPKDATEEQRWNAAVRHTTLAQIHGNPGADLRASLPEQPPESAEHARAWNQAIQAQRAAATGQEYPGLEL